MSRAEELLDSLTEEQIATYGINPSEEPHIVIESDKTITVPDELRHIAVQGEHNVETVIFDCPRYWDAHDLSQMQMRIVYQRSDGHREPHLVENLRVDEVDENTIHFDWTISGNVTAVKGNISFMVCAKLSDSEGNREREWHTRLNQDLVVDEGMECSGDEIVEQNPDIIEAILVQLDELKSTGGVSDEQIANAVEVYMTEHPVEGGVDEQEVRDIVDEYLADNPPSSNPDSGENVAQEYFLMKSPNGTVYKVTMTDSGTFQIVGTATDDEVPEDMISGRLLVWSDEFDGTEVDSSKWLFRMDKPQYVNTASVADGMLNMPLVYNEETQLWESHYLHTSGSMDAKYGRFEARMKWDVGCFPAFWIVGQTSQKYNGVTEGIIWPYSGEVDVFEDNGQGRCAAAILWGEREGADEQADVIEVGTINTHNVGEWHTYALEWTETRMVFYCDGVEFGSIDMPEIVYSDGFEPFKNPFYMILDNVSCSHSVPGNTYNCYVDWVRYYAPANITELIPIESIALSESRISLNPGRTREIGLTITPDYVTDYTMRWHSTDRSIAKFNAGNRIKTLKEGDVVISVQTKNGLTASCNLHVAADIQNDVTGITLDYGTTAEGYVGETLTIKAIVSPKWATYLDCDWESSNENIATVDNGVVTFVGGGTVTITAKAKDSSGVTASVELLSVAEITDNIDTNGCLVKFTRRGWAASEWQSDIEDVSNIANSTANWDFTQGLGYKSKGYTAGGAVVPFAADTSSGWAVAHRVFVPKSDNVVGEAPIHTVLDADAMAQTSGTTVANPKLLVNLGRGKLTVAAWRGDGTVLLSKSGSQLIPMSDTFAPTEDTTLNIVEVHDPATGTFRVYANGALVFEATLTAGWDKITNPILCIGNYPGKTKNTAIRHQAMLGYNRALTMDEVTALNTALDEMYA